MLVENECDIFKNTDDALLAEEIMPTLETPPAKKTLGMKIKDGAISFFEGIEEVFERCVVRFWNKIQIKLFWVVILVSLGVALGFNISSYLVEKKVQEAIILKSFMVQTEKYDQTLRKNIKVTDVYDITQRIR